MAKILLNKINTYSIFKQVLEKKSIQIKSKK